MSLIALGFCSCGKKASTGSGNQNTGGGGNNGNGGSTTPYDSTYNPVDPALTTTQGFFLDDWATKSFTVPNASAAAALIVSPTDTIWVDADVVLTKIPKYVFGANSNLWMGAGS